VEEEAALQRNLLKDYTREGGGMYAKTTYRFQKLQSQFVSQGDVKEKKAWYQ